MEHPPRAARCGSGRGAVTTVAERQAGTRFSPAARVRGWLRNTWGKPRFLVVFTWAYILWSIVPVLIAVQFSFKQPARGRLAQLLDALVLGRLGRSVWHDPTLRHALVQTFKLAGADVLIAVPIGVMLALGLARWRGRGSGARISSCSSRSSRPRSSWCSAPPRLHGVLHFDPHGHDRADPRPRDVLDLFRGRHRPRAALLIGRQYEEAAAISAPRRSWR